MKTAWSVDLWGDENGIRILCDGKYPYVYELRHFKDDEKERKKWECTGEVSDDEGAGYTLYRRFIGLIDEPHLLDFAKTLTFLAKKVQKEPNETQA